MQKYPTLNLWLLNGIHTALQNHDPIPNITFSDEFIAAVADGTIINVDQAIDILIPLEADGFPKKYKESKEAILRCAHPNAILNLAYDDL